MFSEAFGGGRHNSTAPVHLSRRNTSGARLVADSSQRKVNIIAAAISAPAMMMVVGVGIIGPIRRSYFGFLGF